MSGLSRFPDTVRKATQIVTAVQDVGSGDLESQERFSVLDRKVFNALLAAAYPALPHAKTHKILMRDLALVVSEDPERVKKISESLERLSSIYISIDWVDADKREHRVRCHYLSYIQSAGQDGMIEFAFDPIALHFLSDPQVYSKIRLSVQAKFKTGYGLKLYEMMQGYYRRYHKVWTVTLPVLKTYFEVPVGTYERFDHLKKMVIDKAVEEVNRYAEFKVAVSYHRAGRGGAVQSVSFEVQAKPILMLKGFGETPAMGGPVRPRDKNTVDMFSGSTTAEMEAHAPDVSDAVLQQVARIAGSEDEAIRWRDAWFDEYGAKSHFEPDQNFLAWAQLRAAAAEEENLKDVSVDDFFNNFLGGAS